MPLHLLHNVKFVIARLDAVFPAISTPKMEPISSTSDELTTENGQTETVSAQFVSPHISPSPQPQTSGPQVKLPKLELKKLMGMLRNGVLSGTLMKPLFTKTQA